MKRILVLPALLLAAFLAGCGGGTSGSGGANPDTSGRATFTVQWPERNTRLIPVTSESIKLVIENASGAVVDSTVLDRPTSGNQTVATLTNLPVGTLRAVATAHPQAAAAGTAQARGVAPLVIQSGQTTQVVLTMQTTIVNFTLSPAIPVMNVGDAIQLIETARDIDGNVVLTDPTQIEWSTANDTIAGVTLGGRLTARTPGRTTVSVRDKESGFTSAPFTVDVAGILVTPKTATVAPNGTVQFTARVGITGAPASVLWTVAGGTANGRISSTGLYTAPNRTLTAPVTITATTTTSPTYSASATVTVQ